MSILPIPALNALVTKTMEAKKTLASSRTAYQHKLHYLLKGLGQLPAPVIKQLNQRLNAATAEQYPHADTHLRLIMAVNNRLKKPLSVDKLLKLRKKFATDVVSMQAPSVWQQASATTDITAADKNAAVNWQDQVIANGDGGDMTIRCYQHPRQKLTAASHRSDDPNKNVVMLFFHGGGFCIGDINTHHEFCHAVCSQTGWAVVSVDYRLAPEHRAPTALKDCLAAYAWLAEHCETLGASSARIVLSGDSAGGCLASLVAQQLTSPTPVLWQALDEDKVQDRDQRKHQQDPETFIDTLGDLPLPLAQLPLYPVTDYGAEHPSWGLYGQGLLLDHDEAEAFNTAYIKQSPLPQAHPLVSVMHGDNSNMCPSYIVAAELDILRDEALAYAKLLQNNGTKVETYTVLGAPHGFINLIGVHQGLNQETSHIISEFAKFVRKLLTT